MSDNGLNGADTGASANGARTPPYISFATLLTFFKALKTDGVPPQIDKSVMGKMAGGLQGQMKVALKSLGLMEGDKPTDKLKEIVDAYDTPAFEAVLRERLQVTYPYIFQLDLMTATPTMLADAFKVTGAKEDVLRKCRTFFLHAAKRAGVPLGTRIATGSVPRTPSNSGAKRKPKPAKGSVFDGQSAQGDQKPPNGTYPDALTNALLAKFPPFDPKWPDNIKTAWFEGFGKFMGMASPKD